MFKKCCLALGWLIVVLAVFTRSVSWAEEDLSFEERNKDKPGILLLYEIETRVKPDWSIVTKFHKVFKVLKEEARERAEMRIDYEAGRESVSGIKVFTITPDGKRHAATKVQDMKLLANYPMYSDGRVKVITQPEVNVGAILDRQYTLAAKSDQIKGEFWLSESNDVSLPIKEYRHTIVIPKKLGIRYKETNMFRKPKITGKGGNIVYTWEAREIGEDVPRDEEFAPPPRVGSLKEGFEFSSIKSWTALSRWYFAKSQEKIKLTPLIEAAARKAAQGKVTVRDKTRAILEYVEDNFRYVSMSFGRNSLEPHPTDEVFKNKYGDCKDLSLLTKAMLGVVGVKARLALFANELTSYDPKDRLPDPNIFDHVLLLVEDKEEGGFYADPLLKGYDIGEYPVSYQLAYTLIIDRDGGKLDRLPLFAEDRYLETVKRAFTIQEDGSALEEFETVFDLDASIEMRAAFKAMDKKEKEEFDAAWSSMVSSNGEILEKGMDGLEARYGVIKGHSRAKQKDMFQVTDGLVVINSHVAERQESVFTARERKEPIFYPGSACYDSEITYRPPEGFVFSHVPDGFDLDNGFYQLKREYNFVEGGLAVKDILRYRRAEIPASEYGRIKKFYDELPGKTKQQIIMKRSGGK